MVSKPEFAAASLNLVDSARAIEEDLLSTLQNIPSVPKALGVAQDFGVQYYQTFDDLFDQTLRDAAVTTTNFYNKHYALGFSDSEIQDYAYQLIDDLKNQKYHGLNYQQRSKLLNLSLNKRFAKSSSVGYNLNQKLRNISRALTEPYPFGAQTNLDKRFLLSELVRMEHAAARQLAAKAGIELIKWNLSGSHNQVDICDEYASAVNKDVVIYLQENDMQNVDPQGLYFIDEVPRIPHPNCQCELTGLGAESEPLQRPQTRRSIKRVMKLVERLLRK